MCTHLHFKFIFLNTLTQAKRAKAGGEEERRQGRIKGAQKNTGGGADIRRGGGRGGQRSFINGEQRRC